MEKTLTSVLSIIFVSLCFCSAALCEESTPTEFPVQLEQDASEIFGSILSPFCPGRLLRDCPSSAAAELKNKIRKQLFDGQTKDEVFGYLYGLYGEEIRAAPKAEGFGILAWITPFLFLIIGLFVAYVWLKSRRVVASASSVELSSEMKNRIENELGNES